MTKLLEKAITAVSHLSDKDQDALASLILEELASEERWSKTFTSSHKQLSILAKEALAEYKNGKTKRIYAAAI